MARSKVYQEKIKELNKEGKLNYYVYNPSGKSSDYRFVGEYYGKKGRESVYVKGSGVYQKAYHKIRDIDEGLK